MFEVNTKFGTTKHESIRGMANEALCDMKIPPYYNISGSFPMTMRQSPAYPANGFQLNVAVRYDTLFSNRFSGEAVSRYIRPLKIQSIITYFMHWNYPLRN